MKWLHLHTLSFRRMLPMNVCLIMLLGGISSVHGDDSSQKGEQLLKAAFLYNFAKFVEWPVTAFADEQAPLTICVLGTGPLGAELDHLTGKVIRERRLLVKPVQVDSHITRCHQLYVSPDELARTPDILRLLRTTPVLTVCDGEGCAEAGLMINMRMADNRVALDLNLGTVQRTALKVSSQLLKLAHIMSETP